MIQTAHLPAFALVVGSILGDHALRQALTGKQCCALAPANSIVSGATPVSQLSEVHQIPFRCHPFPAIHELTDHKNPQKL